MAYLYLRSYVYRRRAPSSGGASSATGSSSAPHQRRLDPAASAPYRNLRIGHFLDDPSYGSGGELIPDALRQYYLDTFLDTYESDYLRNFGDADEEDGDEVGPGRSSRGGSVEPLRQM